MLEVLSLAAASAVDPALIAAVAVMLSREKATRLLFAYLIGGSGVSLGAGIIILFALGRAGFGNSSGNSASPGVEIAAGAVLLLIATAVATGAGARTRATLKARRRDRANATSSAKASRGRARSFVDRVRAGNSPWLAWAAGVLWGVPGAFYLAALALTAKRDDPTATKIGVVLVFNVVMFALVEIPLAVFFVAPDFTRSAVRRCNSWVSSHKRTIAAAIAGAVGAYLVVKGLRSQTTS